MKKLITALVIGAGLLSVTLLPATAQTNAVQGSQSPAASNLVPELSPEQVQKWNGKLNNYVALYNRSSRAIDSWNRYRSWVNIKTGPTGKERIVYGLYGTYDDVVKELGPRAVASAGNDPKMGALDTAAISYVEALNKLEPILNETVKYYDRKDYSDDKFAHGKELHPKLVEAFETVVNTRSAFDRELTAVKAEIDRQELAQIEKTEGKKFNWHFRRVFMGSQKVIEAAKAVNSKSDAPAFSEAVKAYGIIVREFDDYVGSATDIPPERTIAQYWPDQILSAMRGARDALEKGSLQGFSGGVQGAVTVYNQMVTFSSF